MVGGRSCYANVALRARARQRPNPVIWLVYVGLGLGCEPNAVPLGVLNTVAGGARDAGQSGGTSGTSANSAGFYPTSAGVPGVSGQPWTLGPFDSPRAIAALAFQGAVTTDPTVTDDGSQMYMMSTRSGSKDIWSSRRGTASAEWAPPSAVAELNSVDTESNANVSRDGLSMWFYTDRDRGVGTLWQAHRVATTDAWSAPTLIPGICDTASSDIAVTMNHDESVAILASMRNRQTQAYDLLEARRTSTTRDFDPPLVIAEVSSSADDFDPDLSADGLTLVFHSNRSGPSDIYWTHRSTLDAPFSPPVPLSELNSTTEDVAPAMGLGDSTIWFASTRDGDEQIYEATAIRK